MPSQIAHPSPQMMNSRSERDELYRRLFPAGIPNLWCPSLTHYDAKGRMDPARIAAHLAHLAPHVRGFLIPGSTSDGWELSDDEFLQLFDLALDQARQLRFHLLVGALKVEASETLRLTRSVLERIKDRAGTPDLQRALTASGVCGVAVCPPTGERVSQAAMAEALSAILELGAPTALYQLPQITRNQMGPELISQLARRYPNFILFKDSSGEDRTVISGLDLHGVFTMRGAEGDYAGWFQSPVSHQYSGFLLSTANCFGQQLHQMLEALSRGDRTTGTAISGQVTAAINALFALLKDFKQGNIYANANKAIDHFFAHGPEAARVSPPRLHCGTFLPEPIIHGTAEVLRQYDLLPQKGYLSR